LHFVQELLRQRISVRSTRAPSYSSHAWNAER